MTNPDLKTHSRPDEAELSATSGAHLLADDQAKEPANEAPEAGGANGASPDEGATNGAGPDEAAASPEGAPTEEDATAEAPEEDATAEAPEEDATAEAPEEERSLVPVNDRIGRRTSTTAVHKAAAAFAKHQLPQRGAMAKKLGWLITTLFSWVFTRVDFDERARESIAEVEQEGQLVYVFHTRSLIDYLYFNWAFIEHDLPLSSFANDVSTMWLHPFRVYIRHLWHRRTRRKRDYQLAAFDYHLGCGDPLTVFLNRPRSDEDENLQYSQSYLVRLMEVHERTEKPIHVIPTLLVWDKRPDSKQKSLVDEFFGTSQSPGFFRKTIQFLNMSWQSFFVFGAPIVTLGDPIQLNDFRAEVPEADMAEAAELLRDRLEEEIASERQVIMGPPLKQNRAIKAEVLRKPDMVEAIREVAAEEGSSEPEVRRRATAQLTEIAAEFNLLGIKTLGAILSPIFYIIYRGFHIDEDGLHRLRQQARDSRVILVPSHKSYIDFLVLSYVFYERGLIPPHIAAGVNLSFWPLGPLFRRCGAFFLRRSFKGDALYPTVFKQYLIKLLEEGFMIEFFPEGTRSRTGKLIKPRYGMFRMIIDAFVGGRFDKLIFQPISIGYEKIIEGGSYRRESMGGEKKQESATALIKASSVLTSNYGRVYIEFAEPLSLTDYMTRYEVDRDEPSEEDLQRLTVRLAHRVMYDIAEVTPITPSALAALILLCTPGKGIGAQRMLLESGFLLRMLLGPGGDVRLTKPLTEALDQNLDAELLEALRAGDSPLSARASERRDEQIALGEAISGVLHQALLLLNQNNLVDIREVHDELFYGLSDKQRIDLSYYRNNIVHFFVTRSLLAVSLLREGAPEAEVPLADAQERSLFLSKLFKYEFFYKERAVNDIERTQFEAAFGHALALFVEHGWVEVDQEQEVIRVPNPAPAGLEYMRTILLPYVEPYHFVSRHLDLIAQAEDGIDKKEYVKELLKLAEMAHLQGELQYAETLSQTTFGNAITLLSDLGVLETHKRELKRDKYATVLTMPAAWKEDENYEGFAEQIEPFTGRNRRRLDRAL